MFRTQRTETKQQAMMTQMTLTRKNNIVTKCKYQVTTFRCVNIKKKTCFKKLAKQKPKP